MSKTIEMTIQIVKGFEGEEVDSFIEYFSNIKSGYNTIDILDQFKDKSRILHFKGDVNTEAEEAIELYLTELGIPFVNFRKEKEPFLNIFDGVRSHRVYTLADGTPVVEMSALRSVIDMLEQPEDEEPYADLKALVLANENWVETDIFNMWRYGMENSVAFSSNFKDPNKDIIDIEIDGGEGGSPEITKKING